MKRRDLATPLAVSSFDFEHKAPKRRGTREDRKKQKQEQSKPAPDAMTKKKAAPVNNNVESKKKLQKKEWTYENLHGYPTQKKTKYSPANPNVKKMNLSDYTGNPNMQGQISFAKKSKKK